MSFCVDLPMQHGSISFSDKVVQDDVAQVQDLMNGLQVLEVVGPSVDVSLHPHLLEKLPQLCRCLQHPYTAVRHLASRCLGMLSKLVTDETMNYVLEHLLPLLSASDNDTARQGSMEALASILDQSPDQEGLGQILPQVHAVLSIPVCLYSLTVEAQCW